MARFQTGIYATDIQSARDEIREVASAYHVDGDEVFNLMRERGYDPVDLLEKRGEHTGDVDRSEVETAMWHAIGCLIDGEV